MMDKIIVKANGKINLTLDILGLREDGYHEVEMIMQSIDLSDVIHIYPDNQLKIETESEAIPVDENNLAYKAAALLKKRTDLNRGARIFIEKRIPVAAGLAGGSTDAAAVLKGLNSLWELDLPIARLLSMGGEIGSDVPFCLLGGTALAWNRGELLTTLPPFPTMELLLVKPDFGVSTKKVYDSYDNLIDPARPLASRKFKEALLAKKYGELLDMASNDLEQVTLSLYPEVESIKGRITELGGRALMTGSGPTVMGFFGDVHKRDDAYVKLSTIYKEIYKVITV